MYINPGNELVCKSAMGKPWIATYTCVATIIAHAALASNDGFDDLFSNVVGNHGSRRVLNVSLASLLVSNVQSLVEGSILSI